jgi:hypothetical protein
MLAILPASPRIKVDWGFKPNVLKSGAASGALYLY